MSYVPCHPPWWMWGHLAHRTPVAGHGCFPTLGLGLASLLEVGVPQGVICSLPHPRTLSGHPFPKITGTPLSGGDWPLSQTFPGAGNSNIPRTPLASIQTTSTPAHWEQHTLSARKWVLAELWVLYPLVQIIPCLHKPFVLLATASALSDSNPSLPMLVTPAAKEKVKEKRE